MSLKAVLVLLLVSSALALTGGTWQDLFQPPYSQCPTVMLAISCVSSSSCYIPGGQSSGGFDVYLFNGEVNGIFTPLNMPDPDMAMAIALGGSVAAPHGAVGGFGIGNGVQYAVNATTFLPSLAPLLVVTQDIRASRSGMEVLVIDNGDGNSVLYSNDGGAIFTEVKVTSAVPSGAFARYGAMVNTLTWYVTLGNWPSNEEVGKDRRRSHASARVYADDRHHRRTHKMGQRVQAGQNSSGYSAAIAKTSNGGRTWTTQYASATNFYFNAMDCISATQCVAVGEGFDANAAGHIFFTSDGINWKQVLLLPSTSSNVYSLMSVMYADANTVWAAGSVEQGIGSLGLFVVSNDGGRTWTVTSTGLQNIGDVSDISFLADGTGFATAITIYDDSTILRYGGSAPPGPTPPPQASFTQMQCTDAACTQGCQNLTFAVGACLQVEGGGSAIVECTTTQLTEQFFTASTTCQGASQNTTMALDTCLSSSSGNFFENFCSYSVSLGRRNAVFRHQL